jgi:hypothetical protein
VSLKDAGPGGWDKIVDPAVRFLRKGNILGLQAVDALAEPELERFLANILKEQPAVLLPVYCGKPGEELAPGHSGLKSRPVNIIIGRPLPPQSPGKVIRSEIDNLRIQLEQMENQGIVAATSMLH